MCVLLPKEINIANVGLSTLNTIYSVDTGTARGYIVTQGVNTEIDIIASNGTILLNLLVDATSIYFRRPNDKTSLAAIITTPTQSNLLFNYQVLKNTYPYT